MRQEPNNGIDLLMRQLGRREASPSPELDGQHLDADELNSYVANALPPAARARYTTHLADCSSCRKIVAQLSAFEAPVAVKQPVSAVEPSGLKSFLASLFSPMVLRYAVPALGLIVVAVVGIVMLRQDGQNTSVAQLANTDQNKAVPESSVPVATPTPVAPDQRGLVFENAPDQKESPVAKDAPAGESQPVATAAAAPPPPAKAPVAEADDSAPQPEANKKKAETAEENAPSPRDARRDQAVKQEQQGKYDSTGAAAAPGTGSISKAAEPQSAKSAERARATANFSRGESSSREENKSAPKAGTEGDSDKAEMRTVAGRNFRKRGEVWIDTAYNYQSATSVARGSEQYRALVADEPAIHTIAETLKSEFIVVWKGRAYHVR